MIIKYCKKQNKDTITEANDVPHDDPQTTPPVENEIATFSEILEFSTSSTNEIIYSIYPVYI